ncbi:hypothetical protein D4R42_03780 [bacterium]|nr:MAG: hypothetical protein D4R42_03780 [bacterium]
MSEVKIAQRVLEILLGSRSLDDTITIPAAADPANDVSLYGALRKVFDENTVLYDDWLNGGRLDVILDTLALEATLAIVDGIVDDIVADTNELQADTTREFKAIKTLTFANTVAATDLFTVTGSVIVKIVAICTTLVAFAAAGNVVVGIAADPDAIIATTLATDIDAGEIWHDATPDAEIELLSTRREFIISDGNDIILTPSAQIDTGVIVFVCTWNALEAGSTLVAA